MVPTNHVWTRAMLTMLVVVAVGALVLVSVRAGLPAAVLAGARGFWRGVKQLWNS